MVIIFFEKVIWGNIDYEINQNYTFQLLQLEDNLGYIKSIFNSMISQMQQQNASQIRKTKIEDPPEQEDPKQQAKISSKKEKRKVIQFQAQQLQKKVNQIKEYLISVKKSCNEGNKLNIQKIIKDLQDKIKQNEKQIDQLRKKAKNLEDQRDYLQNMRTAKLGEQLQKDKQIRQPNQQNRSIREDIMRAQQDIIRAKRIIQERSNQIRQKQTEISKLKVYQRIKDLQSLNSRYLNDIQKAEDDRRISDQSFYRFTKEVQEATTTGITIWLIQTLQGNKIQFCCPNKKEL